MASGDNKNNIFGKSTFYGSVCLLLFAITIGLFTTWGYQWVNYLLSQAFNVATGSSLYDLFIGLIAMIASVFLFVGTVLIWKMSAKAQPFIVIGIIGFIFKNILDIINDINPLYALATVSSYDITSASWQIGSDIFQFAFWIFILILFSRSAFKDEFLE